MLNQSGTNLNQICQFDWISRSTFVQVLAPKTACSRAHNIFAIQHSHNKSSEVSCSDVVFIIVSTLENMSLSFLF